MAQSTHLRPTSQLIPPGASPPCQGWRPFLQTAQACTREAGDAIRAEFFGTKRVTGYKGRYDIQLRADLTAQEVIVRRLTHTYPNHGVVAEEGLQYGWDDADYTWVVDPLDGTNNFGYGIAHCAIAITLFKAETVVLSVVYDPILKREFFATADHHPDRPPATRVPLPRASVALVTDYSPAGRELGHAIEGFLNRTCKRVLALWAPALDLALVASGSLDAMVCLNASLMDVCGGVFQVHAAGGTVLGTDGQRLDVTRSMHTEPISFVAARDHALARELHSLVTDAEGW